jgi:hypothetical protein
MIPLLELIQTDRADHQYEQDPDCESCQNGPNPICMRNHGGTCLTKLVNAGGCRIGCHSNCHS